MGLQQCIRKKRAGGALLGDYDTVPHHIRCNSEWSSFTASSPLHSITVTQVLHLEFNDS